MLGIYYLTAFVIYVLFAIGIARWQYKKRSRRRSTFAFISFLIVIFLPFTDIFIQYILVQVHTMFRPPLQIINEVIEKPISVYWEDNVWPGFDEYGRNWMVENYLDGKHLQRLAMNGEDGRIYLYEFGRQKPEVYQSESDLPPHNYKVAFNKIPLFFFERPFIWVDKVMISSTQREEVIGYSTRYCGYGWWLGYDPIGYGQFCKGYVKGRIRIYEFDDKVIFGYGGVKSSYEIDRSLLRR